ncbi:hypothetical protein B1A99_11125 [Cohnella sp. CIP 111063]|uniref:hypothetical protein n=1 Tax=unclassified Cohnella TaxID=2636738 RepID=UPI000B8C2ADD|nr:MULTISPECIES: hypothetical protein [unclassified Cohnella]OXS59180.1 hypothetical protein B1A99_11125 [Cohnella sp. CIP 111063]PRX72188.1 hypothetical protein B0G52_10654 [Cohnella sp. SGD-V74]
MKKLIVVLLAALLSGCGARAPDDNPAAAAPVSPSPVASSMPLDIPSPSSTGLQAIQDTLTGQWEELREKHALELQFVYSTEDAVHMEVRPYGEFERAPTEADIEAFKASLFELAGEPFPVDITVRECCEGEPAVVGKIESVDGKRVLIVNENKKNGNMDDPEAFWVGLTADGKLLSGDGREELDVDDSLVGKEARAWTTGLVNQSYPGQTSAVKIVVE